MCFASYSVPATVTRPGAVMRASPLSQVTLFLRNRYSTPFTLADTTSSLRASMRARSRLTAPAVMPCAAKSCVSAA